MADVGTGLSCPGLPVGSSPVGAGVSSGPGSTDVGSTPVGVSVTVPVPGSSLPFPHEESTSAEIHSISTNTVFIFPNFFFTSKTPKTLLYDTFYFSVKLF